MKQTLGVITTAVCGATLALAASAQAQTPARQAQAIEEIIVTANRREQSMQEVPITLNAISGDDAFKVGITGTSSLQQNVPSLQVARQANQARPFIRGIGSQIGDANSENSVAIYVDGVYQPAAFASFFEFSNIERIEVLKGPQGTLFGRNATGGVIQVVTKDPGDDVRGDISLGYGNYDTVDVRGFISAPLTDNVAFSLAGISKKRDEGYGDNLFTGKDTPGAHDYGVHAKLVIAPSDKTSVKLSGNYYRSENGAITSQPVPGAVAFGGQGYPGEYNVWHDFEERSNIKTFGGSLRVDHNFGGVQLVSISAYTKNEGYWRLDQDLSSTPLIKAVINQLGRMYSQEFHMMSPADSKLQWLIGAYYFDYEAGHVPLELRGFAFDPGFPNCFFGPAGCDLDAGLDWDNKAETTSKAIFAQATYPLGERTNLTLGVRNTWDETDALSTTYVGGTPIVLPVPPVLANPNPQSIKYDEPTWRISLDHKVTDNMLAYVSYNRGSKSGNVTVGSVAWDNIPYEPETLDAYEIGLKTETSDRRVRFNVSGFYYDFTDIQFQKIEAGASNIFNGGSADSYGVEFDLEARPIDNLTLIATAGWLHTEIGPFAGAPNTCRSAVTGSNDAGGFFCNGLDGLPDPGNLIPYDAKGNHLPGAPEFTGSIGFVYDIVTPNSGVFTLSSNLYYNDGFYFELDNRLHVDSFTYLNAALTWTDPSSAYQVTLWGKNLTDEFTYSMLTGQSGGTDLGGPGEPRTFGIRVGYKFGQ
ncbi:MAG: TonB-dependent receptor [Porticoccaceae bacterium]